MRILSVDLFLRLALVLGKMTIQSVPAATKLKATSFQKPKSDYPSPLMQNICTKDSIVAALVNFGKDGEGRRVQ